VLRLFVVLLFVAVGGSISFFGSLDFAKRQRRSEQRSQKQHKMCFRVSELLGQRDEPTQRPRLKKSLSLNLLNRRPQFVSGMVRRNKKLALLAID